MFLLLGLGNPAKKYADTRHNFGFRVVDAFAAAHDFPPFALKQRFRAEVTEARIAPPEGPECPEKVFLAKPQTFMNLSGESARSLSDFFRPNIAKLIAIYDDIDLPFGGLRLRIGGGDGGHRGVKSLIQHFGTENFARLRLGVGSELLNFATTEEFVLGQFSAAEKQQLPKIFERAVAALDEFLARGIESAMNKFN